MKINSINSVKYNNKSAVPFKHTAVPYPEYENSYDYNQNGIFSNFFRKISDLFTPEISEEANIIKSDINNIFTETAGQKLTILA